LNAQDIAILSTYPSVLAVLSHEQIRGRLRIKPVLITTGGECLTPVVREQAEGAFGCKVHDVYAASEFIGIAYDCKYGRLHVSSDWVILEPVDADYHPVRPGNPSHTVLLTNLVNRVQPLMRYEIGDSIAFSQAACPCGSPLPTLRVEGRDDEILFFERPIGEPVVLMPLPLSAAVDIVPGVKRFQLIQRTPLSLQVRLEATPGDDDAQVWERVEARLRAYLDAQGLPAVKIERSGELPQPSAISAKLRHVWSECRSAQHS
jgi:phenylacetate-coenzyme A ligase PaaK-like adenylate-forming protein